MCLFKYTKFGSDFPKKIKQSPDCFIQLALQLAYYKLNKKLVSTNEEVSTRRFIKGRTDNIRSNSVDTLVWVKSMNDNSSSNSAEKFRLFQKAITNQTNLMVQVILIRSKNNFLKLSNILKFKRQYWAKAWTAIC
jgi:hypothetical protein